MRSHFQATDPEALLREVQAADLLNLSVRTLQAWRTQGLGPAFVRAGRAIRYRRSDLLAWVHANVVAARIEAVSSSELDQ
jgi:excisionase family DNA binding protein